jgi:predicted dehydrogenase
MCVTMPTLRQGCGPAALVIPHVRLEEPLYAEISHLVECIRDGTTHLTDGRHGLEVTCVLEALTRSMRNAGNIVPVKYPQ